MAAGGDWGRAHVVTADVSREADVERAAAEVLEHFGRIDILFNNAGINIRKPPDQLSVSEWQEVINVNLTSAFLMSKAVYPTMKQVGGGKIVNIGSMTSIFGSGFAPAYAASKGAIVQLTKSQALAWAKDNIQVNAILPGWFDTELTEKAREQIPGLHKRRPGADSARAMGQAHRYGGHRHLAGQRGQQLCHRCRHRG